MNKLLIALVAAATLFCSACTQNDVVTSLQLSVDAATIALPIVAQSAGITPALEASLETYLQATNTAISQAATILSGPGTPQAKSAQVVAAFAAIAVPAMPAGTPQSIVQAIQAVSTDVAKFLQTVATPKTASISAAPKVVKIDPGIAAKLSKIKSKADSNLTKFKTKK